MTRAVCRNCWTWYSKGETACPNCQVPLTTVDADTQASAANAAATVPTPVALTPTPATLQPNVVAPLPAPAEPTSRGVNWLPSAIAGILLIGLIVAGVLLAGALGPVKSSDGAFSVNAPTGWAAAHGPAAGTVLALAGPQTTGVEAHFIVGDPGQFVPLADLEGSWQTFAESGQFPIAGTLGTITRTTVAGTLALSADFQGSTVAGELIFVDYGSKT